MSDKKKERKARKEVSPEEKATARAHKRISRQVGKSGGRNAELLDELCAQVEHALLDREQDPKWVSMQLLFIGSTVRLIEVTYHATWKRPSWKTAAYVAAMEALCNMPGGRFAARGMLGFTLEETGMLVVMDMIGRYKSEQPVSPPAEAPADAPAAATAQVG